MKDGQSIDNDAAPDTPQKGKQPPKLEVENMTSQRSLKASMGGQQSPNDNNSVNRGNTLSNRDPRASQDTHLKIPSNAQR